MPPRTSWSWLAAVSALCTLAVASPASGQLRAATAVQGFTQPVAFVQDPSDPSVQYVVEQGGRIRVVQNGTVLADDFLNLAGSISAGGERGLLGLAVAGRLRGQRARLRELHRPERRHRRRQVHAVRREPVRRRPGVAPRSAVVHRRARDSAAVRQPQRREPGVRSGRLPLHRDGRRRVGQRSLEPGPGPDHAAREDAADRRGRARLRLEGLPRAAGQPVPRRRCRSPRCPRSGPSGFATRGGTASTTPLWAARARWSSATSGRARSRRSTTSRRARAAGGTTGGGSARARTRTSARCRRRSSR